MKLSVPNISEQAIADVAAVLRSGNLVYGSVGRAFETALASFVGVQEAVVVSSGTAALYIALRGLGIGPGDAVLIPDFSFPATGNSVCMVGARPVMVDVDPHTYCMTPAATQAALQAFEGPERLVAILLVHEFGTPCDMVGFRALAADHDLFLIEDAACALGAQTSDGMVGQGSDVACFSFHPRKTLTTGEGGAIVTDNRQLAEACRMHRNHGMQLTQSGVVFSEPALNFRLTDVQSALGVNQLPHLRAWIETRRSLVDHYFQGLDALAQANMLTLPARVPGQSWQTFMTVLHGRFDRADVIKAMRERGFETNMGAQCLSDTPALGSHGDSQPIAQRLATQGLALPLCELMTADDITRVCDGLSDVLHAH